MILEAAVRPPRQSSKIVSEARSFEMQWLRTVGRSVDGLLGSSRGVYRGHETLNDGELEGASADGAADGEKPLTSSCITFASGARQLVVQEAFEITLYSGLYASRLTPQTNLIGE